MSGSCQAPPFLMEAVLRVAVPVLPGDGSEEHRHWGGLWVSVEMGCYWKMSCEVGKLHVAL